MIMDCIIAIAATLAAYRGWKKGIVSALLTLVGYIVGAVLALKLSHTTALYLSSNNIINNAYILPICYVFLFLIGILFFQLVIKFIEGFLSITMLGWANRLCGAVVFVFISVFLFSSLITILNYVHVISNDTKTESKVYNIIEPIAPKTVSIVSPYIPYCKNVLEKIKDFTAQTKTK